MGKMKVKKSEIFFILQRTEKHRVARGSETFFKNNMQ